jgi:hypothetical protein
LAYVRSNLFYLDLLAGNNLVLFATGFYDRVHISPFSSCRLFPPGAHAALIWAARANAKPAILAEVAEQGQGPMSPPRMCRAGVGRPPHPVRRVQGATPNLPLAARRALRGV